MTHQLTRAQADALDNLFLATQQHHGRRVAVETIAVAAVEAYLAVGPGESVDSVSAVRQLISETCRARGVLVKRLLGHIGSRDARTAAVRRELMARISALGYSLPTVGRFLRRHHTTVHFGLKVFRREQPALAAQLLGGDELAARRAA